MNQIYISKESLVKLKATSTNKDIISVFEKFSLDRQKIKNKQQFPIKTNISSASLKKFQKEKDKTKNIINNPSKEALDAMKILGTTTPLSKKEARKKLDRIKKAKIRAEIERQKLKKVQAYSKKAPLITQHVAFLTIPQSSKKSHNQNTAKYKKEKPLINITNNDSYNFANEYTARNVEFGHGRQKSQEWNDKKALTLQKELQKLRELQKSDPNLFDREATK